MNTGAKLAIAGVGTVVLVVIIYAIVKSSRNTTAAIQQSSSPAQEVPVMNYNDKKIDVSGISKPAATNANTITQPPSETYNPPPIPGGIGYYKNKPQMKGQ